MKQADVFYHSEGDNYHDRNRDKELNSRVLDALFNIPIKPTRILEVGCGDGRYLNELHKHFRCSCHGIDPSAKAIQDGQEKFPQIGLRRGTARDLMPHIGTFDLIIFGFCLYLVDRDDLPYIVADANNCLEDQGLIAIHDFKSVRKPEAVPYKHSPGLYSYKMDYPMLWTVNPSYAYERVTPTGDDTEIAILQKIGWEKYKCKS